jgi:hypothetical protein
MRRYRRQFLPLQQYSIVIRAENSKTCIYFSYDMAEEVDGCLRRCRGRRSYDDCLTACCEDAEDSVDPVWVGRHVRDVTEEGGLKPSPTAAGGTAATMEPSGGCASARRAEPPLFRCRAGIFSPGKRGCTAHGGFSASVLRGWLHASWVSPGWTGVCGVLPVAKHQPAGAARMQIRRGCSGEPQLIPFSSVYFLSSKCLLSSDMCMACLKNV